MPWAQARPLLLARLNNGELELSQNLISSKSVTVASAWKQLSVVDKQRALLCPCGVEKPIDQASRGEM